MKGLESFVKENKEILLLLLLLSLFFFSNLGAYRMFMWDEAEYASIARSLLRGDGYTINGLNNVIRIPVYPLSIAFFFALFGISYEVSKIPGILYYLVSIFALYFFAKRHIDKKTALVAAFLLAVTPLYFTLTLNTLSDVPFACLFLISAMLFYECIHRKSKLFYVAAVFLALSFLTRYNAVLFLPIFVLYLSYLWTTKRKVVLSLVKYKHLYLSVLPFLAIVIPWLFYVYRETGSPLSAVLSAPARIAVGGITFPWYYYVSLSYDVLGFIVFLLLIAGAAYVMYKKNDFGVYCLVFVLVNFTYFSQFGWKEERMMVSWIPFMAVLAALGLVKVLYPWLKRDIKNEYITLAVCGLVLLSSAYLGYEGEISPKLKYSTAIGYPSLIQASSYIEAAMTPEESALGASMPQYYWYSNRVTSPFPRTEEGFVDALAERNVRIVIMNNYERTQPAYVMQAFAKAFFNPDGSLKYSEDAARISVFGDISRFNDPMRYPVTIVVPTELFAERINATE